MNKEMENNTLIALLLALIVGVLSFLELLFLTHPKTSISKMFNKQSYIGLAFSVSISVLFFYKVLYIVRADKEEDL